MPSSDLATYFRNQASWRAEKAAEYPNDVRNEMSAKALRSVAEYIDSGEAEARDSSIVRQLESHLAEGQTLGGERAQREAIRYGFGHMTNASTHEPFLRDELWVACMEDAYAFAGEHGEDWTDELFPFEVDAAKDGVFVPRRYWERRSSWHEHEAEEAIDAYRSVA